MKKESFKNPNTKNKQRGASLTEYSLLVALIAMVSIGAVRKFGTTISNQYDKQAVQISTASSDINCAPGNPGYPACLAW